MGNVLTLVFVAALQAAPDPLLARFEGQWSGEGTVLKMPSKVQLTWERTLDGQFLRLTFSNQMGPSRRFEGHAYYRALGNGRYRGTWFDNSGMIRPIDATRVDDSLVSKWGTADTELGETTYRLQADGSMEIVDRVQGKDGTWRDFGRVVVNRR
jgi:hypothetical protein